MAFSFSPGNLIVCGEEASSTASEMLKHACTFKDLVLVANTLINDLVFISTILATVSFIIVGIKLLTSGGNPEAMKSAKDTLFKVVIGYVIVLAAWIVVYTIMNVLLKPGYTLLVPR